MKKSFALLYLQLSISSCAQKELKKEEIVDHENIKKVENIYKEVKVYDYNPQYTLHIKTAANFSFEILINDFPIQQNYESGIVTESVPINEAELKKCNLPEVLLSPDEVYEQFKNNPILPWFPEDVKKHLEEAKIKK